MSKLTEEMKQMIASNQCFIATVSPDGMPNIGPKASTRVLDDNTLVFAEGTAKQTLSNVTTNGKVAIAVVNREVMNGYRFVGTATVHESGPVYDQVAQGMIKAGRAAPRAAVTVAVDAVYSLKPGPTAGTKIS